VSATKFNVHEHAHGQQQHSHPAPDHHHHHDRAHDHGHAHAHPHRSLPEIFALIDSSGLTAAGRDRAKEMFGRLAEAEAAIHQMPVEQVHLHEVGALDSIIDIVGIVHAMEWAGADTVVCSPLNVGGGMVQSAHGLFPVPAPATVRLLGGAPVYSGAVQKELVTPTGALIATTFATSFGPLPAMSIERVGYGAGERDDPSTPNVLRVLVGRAAENTARAERVTVIECEIDDMNPQIFGVVMDQLHAAGALDVYYTSVQMKKNRPGTLLTVVAKPERQGEIADLIFRETTTIGLRHYEVDRECLQRELVTIETPLGTVRFKVARRDGRVMNAVPEFEDCAKLAAASNLPVKEVQAIAIKAYQR
jgi:pyridinium-3,5-bisthiocarboxylic acid mononucleotide nickel chelatase